MIGSTRYVKETILNIGTPIEHTVPAARGCHSNHLLYAQAGVQDEAAHVARQRQIHDTGGILQQVPRKV